MAITRRKFFKKTFPTIPLILLPYHMLSLKPAVKMKKDKIYDVVIVGGSFAGLSAGLALGRALRNVLIIDAGKPCNRYTPHAHNFITHDGDEPSKILKKAKDELKQYTSVSFTEDKVLDCKKNKNIFEIKTDEGRVFFSKKIIFATGIKDIIPKTEGFASCWGKSIIHCPYCHSNEFRDEKTGILANRDEAFHYTKLIHNWPKKLTVFTNGMSTLTANQANALKEKGIEIIEKEVQKVHHTAGKISFIQFSDESTYKIDALYNRPQYKQHCIIPERMGCEMTENGLIKVDMFQKTNIEGVLACGDSTSPLRAISQATATGGVAGAVLNNLMIEEEF